eukprot:SAG31_NODE_13195_length_886_cov_1.438374_1_plen_78_part_01
MSARHAEDATPLPTARHRTTDTSEASTPFPTSLLSPGLAAAQCQGSHQKLASLVSLRFARHCLAAGQHVDALRSAGKA